MVAVGTARDCSMLTTTRAAAPRSGRVSAWVSVPCPAAGDGCFEGGVAGAAGAAGAAVVSRPAGGAGDGAVVAGDVAGGTAARRRCRWLLR